MPAAYTTWHAPLHDTDVPSASSLEPPQPPCAGVTAPDCPRAADFRTVRGACPERITSGPHGQRAKRVLGRYSDCPSLLNSRFNRRSRDFRLESRHGTGNRDEATSFSPPPAA